MVESSPEVFGLLVDALLLTSFSTQLSFCRCFETQCEADQQADFSLGPFLHVFDYSASDLLSNLLSNLLVTSLVTSLVTQQHASVFVTWQKVRPWTHYSLWIVNCLKCKINGEWLTCLDSCPSSKDLGNFILTNSVALWFIQRTCFVSSLPTVCFVLCHQESLIKNYPLPPQADI